MKHRAIQVVDLGFGDSGKGTMVDYLVRRYESDLVVRFNGGPQAGHNVALPDGRHHTFSQFGSGSFVSGVRTLLSRYMLIEPYAMLNEAAHLKSLGVSDILGRTFIDERCLVITPPQQVANRIRERARGEFAHGTCGMGLGECVRDQIEYPEYALFAADFCDRTLAKRKLRAIHELKSSELNGLRDFATTSELQVLDDPAWIETALDKYVFLARKMQILPAGRSRTVLRESINPVFEGAQGVLLDERYGFHPHTTWSQTTFTQADLLSEECQTNIPRERIGVMRCYLTRHGLGPFVTGDESLRDALPEPHNRDDGYQGAFRCGVLDLVLLRYALSACGGVDALAITHLDRLSALPAKACDAYDIDGETVRELFVRHDATLGDSAAIGRRLFRAKPVFRDWPTESSEAFIEELELALKTSVGFHSSGATYLEKKSK